MALEINDQYDFFKAVQIDDDGNLLVSIVNQSGGTGDNYYTTAATLSGSVITFDRTDLADAYSVDLSGITATGDYLPLSGGVLTGGVTGTTIQGTTLIATYLNTYYVRDAGGTVVIDTTNRTLNTSNGLDIAYDWENGIFYRTTSTIFDCGGASVIISDTLDGGSGSTLDFEYNANNGTVALATEPEKSYPYKVDRLTSGSAYTFSGEINVLSIDTLTQNTTINLPQFANNNFYTVKDNTGNAGIYAITVEAGNKTINGEDSYIINIGTKPSITFLWNGVEYITI